MTSPGVIVLMLALAGAPAPANKGSRFEQGQRLFHQGDFEGALKQLELAAQDEREPSMLEKIHLLRGQAFAARQDFVRAEDAFALALEANPEASLDPARVDPTVVKVLDSVRTRQSGLLVVSSTPPGAQVALDGKPIGTTPLQVSTPIGKHRVEATWGELVANPVEFTLRIRREVRIEFVQGKPPPPVTIQAPPEEKPVRPLGDVRGIFEVQPRSGADAVGALEVGAGIEVNAFRAGLAMRLFPYFGVVPRVALSVPTVTNLQVFVEVQVPIWLTRPSGGIGVGIGGAAGAEYWFTRFFGVFLQGGGHYLFVNPMRGDAAAVVLSGGLRLRAP